MPVGTGIVDKIQAELNTKWNISVIAKPKFLNKRLQTTDTGLPGLLIDDLGTTLEAGDLSGSSDIKITQFQIICVAETELECRKLLSECRRIINAYTPSEGGVWRVIDVEPHEGDDFSAYIILGEETVLMIVTGW